MLLYGQKLEEENWVKVSHSGVIHLSLWRFQTRNCRVNNPALRDHRHESYMATTRTHVAHNHNNYDLCYALSVSDCILFQCCRSCQSLLIAFLCILEYMHHHHPVQALAYFYSRLTSLFRWAEFDSVATDHEDITCLPCGRRVGDPTPVLRQRKPGMVQPA
jgi:hypothetical protein